MYLDVKLVTGFEMSEFQERRVEDDPLRITDFGNGLDHLVKLCLPRSKSKCPAERYKDKSTLLHEHAQ